MEELVYGGVFISLILFILYYINRHIINKYSKRVTNRIKLMLDNIISIIF